MNKISPEQVNGLIRKRRSILPNSYNDKPIPKEIIEQVLENANWAPNHRKTEPWRFKVIQGAALEQLGILLSDTYKAHSPEQKFSEPWYNAVRKKPMLADTVIIINMQRDPKESLPEWEEIAAVGCAVQNMYLTCTAYDVGCYWSTPEFIKFMAEPLGLNKGERCLGFFFMGYHNMPEVVRKRGAIGDKTEWGL